MEEIVADSITTLTEVRDSISLSSKINKVIDALKRLEEPHHKAVEQEKGSQGVYENSQGKDFVGNKYVPEPILTDNQQQYTFFPIKDKSANENYKIQVSSFWTVEEVDLGGDQADFEQLTPDEKFFVIMIVAFFAASDGLVNANIVSRFLNEIKQADLRRIYTFQVMMEEIHSEMYGLLLMTYVRDLKMQQHYLNAIESIPCIKKKADWVKKWIDSDKTFTHRLVANAVNEGLFFSGAFCAIFWIKEKGKLAGLTVSNELINRDEGSHVKTGCYVYSILKNKLKEHVIHDLVDEAVIIEKEFICESLPCALLGMNSDLMSKYIEYVADTLLVNLGYNKKYHSKNPFPFMEKIGLESVSNFFEKRVSEYGKRKADHTDFDIDSSIQMAMKGIDFRK